MEILNTHRLLGRLSSAPGVESPVPGHVLTWKNVNGDVTSSAPVGNSIWMHFDHPISSGIFVGVGITKTSGILVEVVLAGSLTDSTWNWGTTKPLFYLPNGVLTQTPPTQGRLQIVAQPITSDTIVINIQPIIQLGV